MAKRTVNPLITAMNEGIASAKSNAKRSMENAKSLLASKALLRAKYGWIFSGMPSNGDSNFYSMSMHGTSGILRVVMMDLDSFRDTRLTTLLERLLTLTDNIQETEYADYLNKDYEIQLDDLRVSIAAYVKRDSETCRKVEIGTEIKEVKKYKIVCG